MVAALRVSLIGINPSTSRERVEEKMVVDRGFGVGFLEESR